MNKMLGERNKLSRDPYKKLKDHLSDSKRVGQSVRSRHQTLMQLATCFALTLGYLGFVPPAIAHSGLDPEIDEITEELTKNPDSVDLLISRGQVYRSNGKFIESLQDIERAWLLDRKNRTVLLERAFTLSAMGHNKEAEVALDSFLQDEAHPKRVFALAERAHIRARTGQVEAAIADFSAVIQLQPTIELYLIRGKLQESLKKFEDAEEGYYDGLTKLGDALLLKNCLIRVQLTQKKYSEALAIIKKEVTRSSVKTPWLIQQAEILAIIGQPDASHLAYEQALSETSRVLAKRQTAMQLLARAEIYQAMGRMEEAKHDLRVAIQKAPHFSKAANLLNKIESR